MVELNEEVATEDLSTTQVNTAECRIASYTTRPEKNRILSLISQSSQKKSVLQAKS